MIIFLFTVIINLRVRMRNGENDVGRQEGGCVLKKVCSVSVPDRYHGL